jgi:predicted TIM-barrel fold metal-dependent hydrolase
MDLETASSTEDVTWPLYSSDDHIDLWALPPDLWQARLPKRLRDEGPKVVDRDGVPTWFVGGEFGDPSGQRARPRGALAKAGISGPENDLRPSDPAKRIEDMDRDGLQASVIYGPAINGLPLEDPELKAACWTVWNDWSAEFNAYAPDRLAVLPVLPTHDPAAAVIELERCAALGHRGALMYCFEFRPGDIEWDRLWSAAADTGLPVSFHIGGVIPNLRPRVGSWEGPAYSTLIPLSLAEPFTAMVLSGALERHPNFRLVLAEAGLGWIPYLVNRMDSRMHNRKPKPGDDYISTLPSELVRRQVSITFEEEVDGAEYITMLGTDSFMWASDYPHPDSTFPHSRSAILKSFPKLDEAARRAITADNCRVLYRFP